MASHMCREIRHHQLATIYELERCLQAQPQVVAVMPMMHANGTSQKTKGQHRSPYELRVYIKQERKEYAATIGLTDHGARGLRVYMRSISKVARNAGAVHVFYAAAALLDDCALCRQPAYGDHR